MKKILCFILSFWAITVYASENTETYLPYRIDGQVYTFSTEEIPEGLSVTIKCEMPKRNRQGAKSYSYIYVKPQNGVFSSIVSFSAYSPIELGGKIYSRSSTTNSAFSFKINGVTRDNQAIIIDTRRQGANALDGHCYY